MVDIAGMGLSAAGGGVFGLLGTVAGRVIGLFERREARADRALEMSHELKRWTHEEALQRLQMEADRQETEDELILAATAGSYAGLSASLQAAGMLDAPRWVDAARALVRPVLTPLLWVAVFIVFYRTASTEARWIAETQRADLIVYLVNSVVFAATAATLWWFGDRPPKPPRL